MLKIGFDKITNWNPRKNAHGNLKRGLLSEHDYHCVPQTRRNRFSHHQILTFSNSLHTEWRKYYYKGKFPIRGDLQVIFCNRLYPPMQLMKPDSSGWWTYIWRVPFQGEEEFIVTTSFGAVPNNRNVTSTAL